MTQLTLMTQLTYKINLKNGYLYFIDITIQNNSISLK